MANEHFDLLVVGGGTGRDVVLAAEAAGLRVAVLEKGPLGGTCHNRGCMPSKMLIHSADIADAVREGPSVGIHARIDHVDFPAIVRDVFATLDAETAEREEELRRLERVTFFQQEGRFTAPRTMQIGEHTVTADRVVVAGGTRPIVPRIPGLDRTPHLTSDEVLRLSARPDRLVMIGGGYISCELAHFFGAIGTEVTIIHTGPRLLDREDAEIGEWLTRLYQERYAVHLNATIQAVAAEGEGVRVEIDGREPIHADQLLVATGRRPNSDTLDCAAAGLDLDERGYVRVNEYLETNQENVWALGDITGIFPLKHVAVRQARHITRALWHDDRRPMSHDHIPHAVFSAPQVAAVDRSEEKLREAGLPYKVGRWRIKDTGMGIALREDGLVKVLAGPNDEILGCHIVGPHASILIQEVVVALNTTGTLDAVVDAVHAHPTLPQAVEEACRAAQAAPLVEPA